MGLRDTLRGVGATAAPALVLAGGLVLLDQAIATQRRNLEQLQHDVQALTDAVGYARLQVNGEAWTRDHDATGAELRPPGLDGRSPGLEADDEERQPGGEV